MEANEAKSAASTDAATVQKPYMVVCADMAFYCDRGQCLGPYEVVYTTATDEDAACDQARRALRNSGIPLAAFNRMDLQRIMSEMADCELNPGEARNWTRGMTNVQMQAAYADCGTDDEQGI